MLTPDTLVHDRYRVVALIGQGGMGAVYEAIDQRLRTRVALKQTTAPGEAMSRAFEREAQILAGLRHPGLPRVIDYFLVEAGQFLVMEHIPGQDLGAALHERTEPFAAETVLAWADQILDALDFLHAQEPAVIHRDIKPQNLKLTPRGELVLLDFGLAKGSAALPATVATDAASLFGYTPQYAPLEQVQGSGTDARSDLYSLGATLYHLLTGQVPPDALARAGELLNGRADPVVPARELRPELSPALSGVLQQAMAVRPTERFQTARAMRRALASLDHDPAPVQKAATGPTLFVGSTPAAAARLAPSPPEPLQLPQPAPSQLPSVGTERKFEAQRERPGPERRGPTRSPLILGLVVLLLLGAVGLFALRQRSDSNAAVSAAATALAVVGTPIAELPDAQGEQPVVDAGTAGAEFPEAIPITLEEAILVLEGEITSPGQQIAYSFQAEPAREIYIWQAEFGADMSQIDVTLLDERGDEIGTRCLGCGDLGVQPLREGGTYTLVVGDKRDPATGPFELRVNLVPVVRSFDVDLDIRVSGDEPAAGADTVSLPGAKNAFTLEAEPGEQIFVWTASFDPGMEQIDVTLLDARGDEVQSICMGCGNLGVQTLSSGGIYTLRVGDDRDPATGVYDLRISSVPPVDEQLVRLPSTLDAEIAKPGAAQAFSFEVAPGAEIFVRAVDYDEGLAQIDITLLDTRGDEVASRCMGCGDMGAQKLREGGTYTLTIGDQKDPATGNYTVEITLIP